MVFSWDIDTAWQLETDLDRTSEVEVRFMPEGSDRTRVELEHRNLDRHGTGGTGWPPQSGRRGDGWGAALRLFAARLST